MGFARANKYIKALKEKIEEKERDFPDSLDAATFKMIVVEILYGYVNDRQSLGDPSYWNDQLKESNIPSHNYVYSGVIRTGFFNIRKTRKNIKIINELINVLQIGRVDNSTEIMAAKRKKEALPDEKRKALTTFQEINFQLIVFKNCLTAGEMNQFILYCIQIIHNNIGYSQAMYERLDGLNEATIEQFRK